MAFKVPRAATLCRNYKSRPPPLGRSNALYSHIDLPPPLSVSIRPRSLACQRLKQADRRRKRQWQGFNRYREIDEDPLLFPLQYADEKVTAVADGYRGNLLAAAATRDRVQMK